MKAIIYSSGPSMRRWIGIGQYLIHTGEPLRIGLNGAFQLLPNRWCHWCASGDVRGYSPEYTANRSTIGLCCLTPEYFPAIRDHGWDVPRMLSWADLPALRRVCSPSWSIIGAIALADYLGADDIHIYGWDMAVDQPNATEPGDYTSERAEREKNELASIRAAIGGTITIHDTKGNA
jgi:hypothetical protein